MSEKKGVIYILTNPSFPEYVKIGYADDVERRLTELNRSECIPFAFRIYATYEVPKRLSDLSLHKIIDRLNPKLRTIDTFNGKPRKKEFYAMTKEEAYFLLESIAEIHDCVDKLKVWERRQDEIQDETLAEEVKFEKDDEGYYEQIESSNRLNTQELYSLLHSYLEEKNNAGILRYDNCFDTPDKLYFLTNHVDEVFPKSAKNNGWHKTGHTVFYLLEIREKVVNLQIIFSYDEFGRKKMYEEAVDYLQNIGVKVIKDNPRYAGYFPFVVRMKRDGLDKEKLYKTLDESLLSILKKEAEVYKK